METTYPTHQEAKTSLDLCLELFADSAPMNEADIKTAFHGVANSLQIRDYALGAVGYALNDYQDIRRFFTLFGAIGGESAHLEAVWSAFAYEAGNTEEAYSHLNKAKELDPSNSLAGLLSRVFASGWLPEGLKDMRDICHPKVVEGLKEIQEVRVNESN